MEMLNTALMVISFLTAISQAENTSDKPVKVKFELKRIVREVTVKEGSETLVYRNGSWIIEG